jgi:hypothetical protein
MGLRRLFAAEGDGDSETGAEGTKNTAEFEPFDAFGAESGISGKKK